MGVKGTKRANKCISWLWEKKWRDFLGFVMHSYLKEGTFTAVIRNVKNKAIEGLRNAPILSKIVCKKVRG